MPPVPITEMPKEFLLVIPAGMLLVGTGLWLLRRRREPLRESVPEPPPEPTTEAATEPPPRPAMFQRGMRLGLLALVCGPFAGLVMGGVTLLSRTTGYNYRMLNAISMVILGALAGILGGATFALSAVVSARLARRSTPEPEPTPHEPES